MSFQTTVKAKAPPGIVGDFAGMNPRATILATEGNLVAPAGGLTVGNFCFVNPATGAVSANYVSGYQIGFLGRNQQGLITVFLAEATQMVPQGFAVTLHTKGDFWARFASAAVSGAAVYADQTTGAPVSGSATDTATAAAGYTGTASFATNVMTLVTTTAGAVSVGDAVTSAGVAAGTTVTAKLSATTFTLSTAPGTIATQAASTTSTSLIVSAILTGALSVGDVLSGTGVTAGTTITSVPPAGGAGVYGLSVAQNFAATTVTVVNGNVATGFTVRGNCSPGEIAFISA